MQNDFLVGHMIDVHAELNTLTAGGRPGHVSTKSFQSFCTCMYAGRAVQSVLISSNHTLLSGVCSEYIGELLRIQGTLHLLV